MRSEDAAVLGFSSVAAIFIILVVALGMWGCPKYGVYQRSLAGQAELAQAEFNRQIAVREAQARLESAELERQAEVLRARGVAEANEIVAEGLGGPEGYLRYLWIQGLQDGTSEVIYVPTEANLPILEATRLRALLPRTQVQVPE